MAAATCQTRLGTGASVTWADAESAGVKLNRYDSATDVTPIPIPATTGTKYSWIKNFVLYVTVTGTTSISNRRVSQSAATPTGVQLFWKTVAVASYVQAASGNMPADDAADGHTPSGYTLMSTTPAQYDNASVSTGSTGPNGAMAVCCLGVSSTYTGGPDSAAVLPSFVITYDEA